jgi:hypothetical protein
MMKTKRAYTHSAAYIAKKMASEVAIPTISKETDAQIEATLKERFDIIEALTIAATKGDVRACIMAGPPGLGKTFTVERCLADWDPTGVNYTHVKGYVKATGLYKLFYNYREQGQVIVLDDADSVFFEDTALSLLKAVCDTTDKRMVHYLAEGGLVDDETGLKIPRTFEFKGTIIFVTNLDFDSLIAKQHKLAPHLQALISRAHYIDLAMKSRRHYLIRIRQVLKQGLLNEMGMSETQKSDVVYFIEENAESLRELSLRMAIKLGGIRKMGGNWKGMARVTCCKVAS